MEVYLNGKIAYVWTGPYRENEASVCECDCRRFIGFTFLRPSANGSRECLSLSSLKSFFVNFVKPGK